jgi:hypothetical protein
VHLLVVEGKAARTRMECVLMCSCPQGTAGIKAFRSGLSFLLDSITSIFLLWKDVYSPNNEVPLRRFAVLQGPGEADDRISQVAHIGLADSS